MARAKLSIYVNDGRLKTKLQARAEETSRSVSYIVRRALAEYLDREDET